MIIDIQSLVPFHTKTDRDIVHCQTFQDYFPKNPLFEQSLGAKTTIERHKDRNIKTKKGLTRTVLISISNLKGTVAELAGKVTKLLVEDAKMAVKMARESAVTPPISRITHFVPCLPLCFGS